MEEIVKILNKKYEQEIDGFFSLYTLSLFLISILAIDIIINKGYGIYHWLYTIHIYQFMSNGEGVLSIRLSSILWAIAFTCLYSLLYEFIHKKAFSAIINTKYVLDLERVLSDMVSGFAVATDPNILKVNIEFAGFLDKDIEKSRKIVKMYSRSSRFILGVCVLFLASSIISWDFTDFIFSAIFVTLSFAFFFRSVLSFIRSYMPAYIYQRVLLRNSANLAQCIVECI